MKRFSFPFIVASSLLALAPVMASVRPRYGGTLRVAIAGVASSLDPADSNQATNISQNLPPLIFDPLVSLDAQGRPKPALATEWESSPTKQHWQFHLRPGVTFSDGTPLSADIVAASLRKSNSAWTVIASGDQITIESESAILDLPAELALSRNLIVKRDGSKLIGSGPFVVSQWDPGRKLALIARDGYWGGRPFLDSVELAFGKSPREQMMAFDLKQVQIAEIPSEQLHQASSGKKRVQVSAPSDLMALVFARPPQSPDEATLRKALSLSINRELINNVMLQSGGDPAGGILPNWMSGYEFVFPSSQDLPQAQQLRGQVQQAPLWNLSIDNNDPMLRVIAERIALNARDAGLRLQLADGGDVRLVRVPLVSPDPFVSLSCVALALGLQAPTISGNTTTDLYAAERGLVQSGRIVPLLHLRKGFAVSTNIKGWMTTPDRAWNLESIWLMEQP
jgi:peptide/nickel transport system substrate-binding protein